MLKTEEDMRLLRELAKSLLAIHHDLEKLNKQMEALVTTQQQLSDIQINPDADNH